MKKFLSCLLILAVFTAKAQVYNNEWIDYGKTYYKFKINKDGLFRLPQSVLANAGLSSVPAEHFQLWRNGVEVPIYTSVASGVLSATDFIEFFGKMNDGKPDKGLYREARFQLNDKWSLLADSATYFLTVNTAGNNRRLVNTVNNVAGNTLPAEPYFMHTVGNYFKNKVNGGYAVNVGSSQSPTYIYSSSYDKGEGWTSNDIATNVSNSATFSNLFVYAGGPDPSFKIAVSGNAIRQRYIRSSINGDEVLRQRVDFFDYGVDVATFPLSKITTNSAAITVTNVCNESPCPTNDKMVIHQYELTYPRQFNFGNVATYFEFSLPASTAGNYLDITGFNYGTVAPVLLDLTNGRRYVADISTASRVKVALEPSATARQLVLVGLQTTNINLINTTLQARNFIDYAQPSNQGNYLIITNELLQTAANGSNPIEEYRAYRSSSAGGGYEAKSYFVDELTDQFGFGIQKHPVAIRNFLLFARHKFTVAPQHVFLIGKGVVYTLQRTNYAENASVQNKINIEKLNLVPTFGVPASDALLTADPGSSIPQIPVGRLSVINGDEVAAYLKKMKEFEGAQAAVTSNREEKEWMKNVVHINGISEPDLKPEIDAHFDKYKDIIADTLFGAKVTTFTKTTSDAVEQISSTALPNLFKEGISLMTYFGHSAATTLEFNLENPESYQNQGKYPLFIALGCNVGDFFTFSANRFQEKITLPEKYVLTADKGTIGFVAGTSYGIVHYLDIWNTYVYNALSNTHYGRSFGEVMKVAARSVFEYVGQGNVIAGQEDVYARANVEQMGLHGDPALKVNPHDKPDYVIEGSFVKMPEFISVAESSAKVSSRFINMGKAVSDSIVIEVKRTYPNQASEVIYTKKIPGIRYSDSLTFEIPIDPLRDKGTNKLTITVDAENAIDEFFETNNSITKEFIVYEDEIRPVYPYNFSIVNKQNIKLAASTANAFSARRDYRMEIDTTALFNSTLKVTKSVNSVGGVLEFEPGLTFLDSTVYYWRVAQVPAGGDFKWNMSSFVYLPNHDLGFNQSHLYQHLKSNLNRISLDSGGTWSYRKVINDVFIKHGVWGTATGQEGDIVVNVNGESLIRNTCVTGIIVFDVFDPKTFKPWKNKLVNGEGLFGSRPPCAENRISNFEYSINDTASRRKAMDFLRMVPSDHYVVVRIQPRNQLSQNQYIDIWKSDENKYGAGNTLYDELKKHGVTYIDSFDAPRALAAVYQNGNSEFSVHQVITKGLYDLVTMRLECASSDTLGIVQSPLFGPAKSWKRFYWQGESLDTKNSDFQKFDIIGISNEGKSEILYKDLSLENNELDVSSINAKEYPFLQVRLQAFDTVDYTPHQLIYWRLTYEPVPEGALAPNIHLVMKDTLQAGEPLEFRIAFKNISETAFDSIKVKLQIIDQNNVAHTMQNYRYKPLIANDTLTVIQPIDSKLFRGNNALFLEVNPDNDQLEQYHFNNIAYRNFFVISDTLSPLLDVTFDNIHILNNDIVSPKPDILIKLKDESQWTLLNDSSLITVKVRSYPNGSFQTYLPNTDTLRFSPAQSTANNTASINFRPSFMEDGIYEMVVTGRDKNNNKAGQLDYRVVFNVINKSMISNLLNYPNPFTTSTAFVFTLTGSEVPHEFKIQVLTVTGKIVREITKQELGPLHIGRNITEYKWDGTDQYGQKLANGVYLYRVVTSNNGKTLEKYKAADDNTDKYFNKGYGKMYLMR